MVVWEVGLGRSCVFARCQIAVIMILSGIMCSADLRKLSGCFVVYFFFVACPAVFCSVFRQSLGFITTIYRAHASLSHGTLLQ